MKYIISIVILLLIFTSCGKEAPQIDIVAESVVTDGIFYGTEIIEYDVYMHYNVSYKESRTSLISELYFNGKVLPKDTTDDKFFLPLSMDTDVWESGTITYDDENITLYFVRTTDDLFAKLNKLEIMSSNRIFIMVAIDEVNQMYTVCRLAVTGLPIITVNNKNTVRDVDYPIRTSDSEAVMYLYNTDQTTVESDILIHARGGSSRSFPKVGYKMNLVTESGNGNNINLLNLRNDDDWVLIPMYSDESMIRDKLSYDLWSEFGATNNDYGIHNGPQAEYIELFIDNRYWGLYMLVVPIDKKQQNLSDAEILCKIESWEVPSVSSLKRAGTSEAVEAITIKKPDKITQSTWNTISEFIDLWFEMPKNDVIETAPQLIDIDNIIDYWIFLNLTKGKDNAWKNMYLTWKLNADGTYTVLISPWDCDLSWGVMWQSANSLLWEYTFYLSEEILDFRIGNNILRYNVSDAVAKLKSRWSELRNGILNEENLFNRIDELTNLVKATGAWSRDLKRWPYGGHAEDNNEYMKEFATAVFKHLDKYIENFN